MKVVNVKFDEYDQYIGRKNDFYGLPESKWANPYKLSEYSLDESLRLYEQHVIESGLYDQLEELDNKRIACWCVPKNKCHGHVLIKLRNQKKMEELIK